MARIRSTHPTQWNDDDFLECSPLARLLAIAIRNFADDNGVFEWKPKQIKRNCLPADACDVVPLLRELVDNKQVTQFTVEGKEYGAIRNFRPWQRPKTPKSQYPCPPNIRKYVGLDRTTNSEIGDGDDDEISEITPSSCTADFHQLEKSAEQMEEVGGRRKDVGDKREEVGSSAPQADAPNPNPGPVESRQKRRALQDNFPLQPNIDEALKHWSSLGRTDLSALTEYGKFRDHHLSRGSKMADWDAAWRTWFRRAVEYNRPPPAPRQGQLREFSTEELLAAGRRTN